MIEMENDTARWIGGLTLGAIGAGIAGVWRHLMNRIGEVEKKGEGAVADIWNVINAERDNASKFRVDITQSVARLPTRDELDRRLGEIARDLKDTIRNNKA